jgi:hypothetical protein
MWLDPPAVVIPEQMAQLRNQEAEGHPGWHNAADVTSGADAAVDEPGRLQVAQGSGQRDTGRGKCLTQFGLAGQPAPSGIFAGRDGIAEGLKDLPVLRSLIGIHLGESAISACREIERS